MQSIWDGLLRDEANADAHRLHHDRIMKVLAIAEHQQDISTTLSAMLGEKAGADWQHVSDALCGSIKAGMIALASLVSDPEKYLAGYLAPGSNLPKREFTIPPEPPHPVHINTLANELGTDAALIRSKITHALNLGALMSDVWHDVGAHLVTGWFAVHLRGEMGHQAVSQQELVDLADHIEERTTLGAAALAEPNQTVTTPAGTTPVLTLGGQMLNNALAHPASHAADGADS